MGLRSRALLTGVATGFLKANNDRRTRMQERMQELADNRAQMERERAKSRYDTAAKGAAEENTVYQSLRSAGHLNENDEYTPLYWKDKTLADWRQNGNGMTHEEYIETFTQGRGKKFQRQYKDMSVIEQDVSKVYDSINAKHFDESNMPVLTGVDRMFGGGFVAAKNTVAKGFNAATSAIGVDAKMQETPMSSLEPQAPKETPTPDFNPMASQGPVETYEDQGLQYAMPGSAPQKIQEFTTDKDGNKIAMFASSDGQVKTINMGVTIDVPRPDRKTEKVRLFDRKSNTYFDQDTYIDINTQEVNIDGTWLKLNTAEVAVVPSDVNLQMLVYKSPIDGEEYQAQAYRTASGAQGANIHTQPDGTTYAITGKPVSFRGKLDKHEGTSSIPDAVKANLSEFQRQHKTIGLTDAMLSQDYVSNPTSWVSSKLSTFTDSIAAAAGFKGTDREGDLEAIIDFANSEISASKLVDEIGFLDAQAVQAGNKDAIQNFLTYALARSQYGEGRMNVDSVNEAKKVVQPWISGTEGHRGALAATRAQAERQLATVVGNDITLAYGNGTTSKIWEYYPSALVKVKQGLVPVADVFEGKKLVTNIKNLENVDKAAYEVTVRRLLTRLGADWEIKLQRPVRVDPDSGTTYLPFFKELKDGSFEVGLFKAK